LIGRGGFGVVHEGSDIILNRTVAVKILTESDEDKESGPEDFLREARTAATLNHSNIVTIYDTGRSDSKFFIVMEYVKGTTLKDLLAARPTLPLPEILGLIKQVCLGLDYAHRKGIVHRDIKPGNILVDEDGNVKITDFGLAKFISDTSIEDSVKGTPVYMSPEQVQGQRLDHRSDIYSLGCMLYRMVAKRPPFTEGNIYTHHVKTPPPPPAAFNSEIPDALNHLILKCLEKDPEQRYPDVASLLRDLEKIV
jgi:serine/threonine protein kinase